MARLNRRYGVEYIIRALIHFEQESVPGLAEFISIYTGIPKRTVSGLLRAYAGKDFDQHDRYRVPYLAHGTSNAGEWVRGNFVSVWELISESTAVNRCLG